PPCSSGFLRVRGLELRNQVSGRHADKVGSLLLEWGLADEPSSRAPHKPSGLPPWRSTFGHYWKSAKRRTSVSHSPPPSSSERSSPQTELSPGCCSAAYADSLCRGFHN